MVRRLSMCTIAPTLAACLIAMQLLHAGDLKSRANQADYLVITPTSYRAQAERLAAFRHGHDGLKTMVVTLDTIVSQFASVSTADSSIREFLNVALLQWSLPLPSVVVLVGNVNAMPSHVEPELPGFIGLGHYDSLSIDQWFVEDPPEQGGGSRMRCALGRLPGWDLTEITTMVDRVIAYETADPAPWWGRATGLADYSVADRSTFADQLRDYQKILAPVWRDTVSVVLDSASTMYRDSTEFRKLWDEGSALLIYSGHANAYTFSVQRYFTAGTASMLRNAPRLPLFLSFGCELRFDLPDPTIASLLMSNASGGAIAATISAGVQWNSIGDEILRGILLRLRDHPTLSVGEAVRQTKDSLLHLSTRRITYLGDPALQLKRPASVAGIDGVGRVPASPFLAQNYPNPFNPSTTIGYVLRSWSLVNLTVFNTLGQQVTTLVHAEQGPGYHEVRFDGSDLPSGVYFYRMHAGTFVETKRLLLLR